jgi:hypothetical protein
MESSLQSFTAGQGIIAKTFPAGKDSPDVPQDAVWRWR